MSVLLRLNLVLLRDSVGAEDCNCVIASQTIRTKNGKDAMDRKISSNLDYLNHSEQSLEKLSTIGRAKVRFLQICVHSFYHYSD